MLASWGAIVFWAIMLFLALCILTPVAVSVITRSFLKAKYDSRIEYINKLNDKEKTNSTRRQ